MSDRWEVGASHWTSANYFEYGINNLADLANEEDAQYEIRMGHESGIELLDFIVELVKEIERLQTDVLAYQDLCSDLASMEYIRAQNKTLREEIETLNHQLDLEWGVA